MTCKEVEDLIELYAAGECDERAADVESHVAGCAACRNVLDEARRVIALVDNHFLRDRQVERILERLGPVPRAKRPSLVRRLWLPLSVAAALLIGLLIRQAMAPERGLPPTETDEGIFLSSGDRKALRDGTTLWARSDTRLKEEGERSIMLVSGELFIRVARSASEKRFVVKTPAGDVTARGTEFCVQAGKENAMGKVMKTFVSVLVLSGIVELSSDQGSVTGFRGESLWAQEGSAPKKQVEDLALRFAKYYEPVKAKVDPKIPPYDLPLVLEKVANFKEVGAKLNVRADDPLLAKNGFVVVRGKGDDIVEPYKSLKEAEIPIVVTADTLLHLYHVQFDETLKEIEEREFSRDITAISEALIADLSKSVEVSTGEVKASARKALTYVAIGLKALKPEAPIPAGVTAGDVEIVLEKMRKHEGFWGSETEWPLFQYAEDFSQYVPRGHYTRSEELKRYFVAMMWYGRMTFILKGGEPHGPGDEPFLVTAEEGKRQTMAAALMTTAMERIKLADGRSAREVWERIYAVTAYYVGLADDLGMAEYNDAIVKVTGAAMNAGALADGKKMLAFKAELARRRPPAIYSGTGKQGTFDPAAGPEKLVEALHKSMGFRFMGQRFIPDSYVMGKMIFPTVGASNNGRTDMFTYVQADGGPIRGFPRGLDVMALLGSARAREILRESGDDAYGKIAPDGTDTRYETVFGNLKKEFDALTENDWNRNLYWSWLYALRPLLDEYGKGYPTFMTTKAWRTKSLTTALASWSQLRHDTILYAKQSYTWTFGGGLPQPPKPVQGYVEPVPEFYARMLSLARMTNKGLSEMKALNDDARKRLAEFEKLLERLLAIAERELANQELKEEDYAFIRNFGEHLQKVTVAPDKDRLAKLEKKLVELEQRLVALDKAMEQRRLSAKELQEWKQIEEEKQQVRTQISIEKDGAMKTTLIADVHTDQNSEQVLEEGTGLVDMLVCVYRQPDGRLVMGAGPVLSYHEFKHPMADRLTDEKWREMLKAKPPTGVEWSKEYARE